MKFRFQFIFICALIAVYSNSRAQTTSTSPYSIYGIGDIETRGLAQQAAMGDAKYGLFNGNMLNLSNPASYAHSTVTVYEVGFVGRNANVIASNGNVRSSESYFKHMGFSFPIGKRAGMGAGLLPYSKYGYELKQNQEVPQLGLVEYEYSGRGGFNNFVFGGAYSLIKDTLNLLSIGVNGIYNFGNIRSIKTASFSGTSGALYSAVNNQYLVSDFSMEGGLFYRRKASKKTIVNFGAVYTAAANLSADVTSLSNSYIPSQTGRILKDTISFFEGTAVVARPFSFGVGTSLEYNNILTIAFDYSFSNWAALTMNGVNQNLRNSAQYSFGVQVIPDNQALTKILKLTQYRAGIRYTESQIVANGEGINDIGISFGFGLPLIKSLSNSMIHFSAEFGTRGNTNNGLIQENYSRLNLGFTFTPHKFDRWFVRKKID